MPHHERTTLDPKSFQLIFRMVFADSEHCAAGFVSVIHECPKRLEARIHILEQCRAFVAAPAQVRYRICTVSTYGRIATFVAERLGATQLSS